MIEDTYSFPKPPTKISIPKWKAWVISSRPKTLIAAWGPLMISLAYLWKEMSYYPFFSFPWMRITMVWIGSFLLQVACNFTNEYYDYLRGTDDEKRVGPKRMLQQGVISVDEMFKGIALLYCLFLLIALILSLTLTWIIMPLSLVSMAVAFFYTGGKYPLSYYGLGDLFAFWFFGPFLVMIVTFVTGYKIIPFDGFTAFLLGLGPGFFSLSLLNINNIRDLEQDRQKGKKTAAIFWGRKISLYLLILFFGICMLLPGVVALYYQKLIAPFLFFFLLPLGIFSWKIFHTEGKEFNCLIGFTVAIYFLQTVVFSLIWQY